MEFSYKAYYRVNFVVPLVVVIAFSVFLLISVASLFGDQAPTTHKKGYRI